MKCPFCSHLEDKVVDSRETKEGDTIRRRRECLGCERRFTTYEKIEESPLKVVKKDGTRVPFQREKIKAGLEKRDWSISRHKMTIAASSDQPRMVPSAASMSRHEATNNLSAIGSSMRPKVDCSPHLRAK